MKRYLNDEDYVGYKDEYVETYLTNAPPNLTIDEWTAHEGSSLFSACDIYKPKLVSVALCGSEYNRFAVDHTKPDWSAQLCNAVKSCLVNSGLARTGDNVALTNVRDRPVDGMTMFEVEQAGALYATVNGKRSIDMPQSAGFLGCAVDTPVTHAVNKDELLDEHISNIVRDASDICVNNLIKAKAVVHLEHIISDEKHEQNILPVISEMIMKNGGHMESFEKLIENHADATVLQGIQNGDISYEDIANDIARCILDEVASAMQAYNAETSSFYQAKALQDSGALQSSEIPKTRTIFGKNTLADNETINAIQSRFPTSKKLHREIVDRALVDNANLGYKIKIIVQDGDVKFKKSCHRRRRKGHGNRGHTHSVTHRDARKERGYAIRDYDRYFKGNERRKMHMVRHVHVLKGLPPAPGTRPVVEVLEEEGRGSMTNYCGKGKTTNFHGTMENYSRRGGSLMKGPETGFPKSVYHGASSVQGVRHGDVNRAPLSKDMPKGVQDEVPSMEMYTPSPKAATSPPPPPLENTLQSTSRKTVKTISYPVADVDAAAAADNVSKLYPGTRDATKNKSDTPPPLEPYKVSASAKMPSPSANISSSLMMMDDDNDDIDDDISLGTKVDEAPSMEAFLGRNTKVDSDVPAANVVRVRRRAAVPDKVASQPTPAMVTQESLSSGLPDIDSVFESSEIQKLINSDVGRNVARNVLSF